MMAQIPRPRLQDAGQALLPAKVPRVCRQIAQGARPKLVEPTFHFSKTQKMPLCHQNNTDNQSVQPARESLKFLANPPGSDMLFCCCSIHWD